MPNTKVIISEIIIARLLNEELLYRAYSRPILRSTIEHCPLLRKLYKAFFYAKHLKKGLNRGRAGGCPFFKKVSFFHKKVPFLVNIERCPKFLEYALTIVFVEMLFFVIVEMLGC